MKNTVLALLSEKQSFCQRVQKLGVNVYKIWLWNLNFILLTSKFELTSM